LASLVACGVAVYVTVVTLSMPTDAMSRGWEIAGGSTFVLSCAASSFFFLALFVRFARGRVRALDSLRDDAYGMYLVHYAFVTWLQLSLLRAPLPAPVKAAAVFLGTVALSWSVTAALRRLPAVARVV
jgi:surface polysaccharide O-acyltransferase-like enzyme